MNERIMRDDRLVGLGPNVSTSILNDFDDTIKITDANGVWLFNPNSLGTAFAEYERDIKGTAISCHQVAIGFRIRCRQIRCHFTNCHR